MFDLQAALTLPQLSHIDDWQRRRETYTHLYNQGFANIGGLQPLQVKPDRRSAYHLYVVTTLHDKGYYAWRFAKVYEVTPAATP